VRSQERGDSFALRFDNGPEFISKALDQWAHAHGVTLYFSRPGKPVDKRRARSGRASAERAPRPDAEPWASQFF